MSKSKPNIITPFNDRDRFKALVQEVINDTTIFTHVPDLISLSGELFTLTLSNKKFVFQDIEVDKLSDYVDGKLILEKPEDNPFLQNFYSDPKSNALPTELSFLFQRSKLLD